MIVFGPRQVVEIAVPDAYVALLAQQNAPVPNPHVGTCLIDTGASNTCIDRGIAQALGLQIINRIAMQTPAGVVNTRRVRNETRLPGRQFAPYHVFRGIRRRAYESRNWRTYWPRFLDNNYLFTTAFLTSTASAGNAVAHRFKFRSGRRRRFERLGATTVPKTPRKRYLDKRKPRGHRLLRCPKIRREWDSNPRTAHHRLQFSRLPQSTALPSLHTACVAKGFRAHLCVRATRHF